MRAHDQVEVSGVTWTTTKDHSKWAVAYNGGVTYACIGDINRQTGQRNRGGGTYCITDPGLVSAFTAVIQTSEDCS